MFKAARSPVAREVIPGEFEEVGGRRQPLADRDENLEHRGAPAGIIAGEEESDP